MGGKRKPVNRNWEGDPFVLNPMEQALGPNPTREIMFAFLAKDKKTALTPAELMEQTRAIRLMLGRIDFHLSQWRPGDPNRTYADILNEIDRLIRLNNMAARQIRDRAEQVIRERQYAAIEAKIKATPAIGAEHVDSARESRDG